MADVMEYHDPQMDEVHQLGLRLDLLPIPEHSSTLPLSLATSKLGSQLVSAHIVANQKEREVKASRSSAVKSSDCIKGNDTPKQHYDDPPKQHHDNGHYPKHSSSADRSAPTEISHRERSTYQE